MNEEQLSQVYDMVDNIPFSKQKKNISRDFSDALMMAQLIHHYYPKKVELHNYPSTNAVSKKIMNWNTLNSKVLKKMGLGLTKPEIEEIASAKPMAIQQFLYRFLVKFERPQEQMKITQHNHRNGYNNYENTQNSYQQQQQIQQAGVGAGEINKNLSQSPAPQQLREQKSNLMNKNQKSLKLKVQKQDTEEILDLIDKIDYAYAQLTKLQQMNSLKSDIIKNLEKKVQKVIFD